MPNTVTTVQPINGITPDAIWIALFVLFGAVSIYNVFMTAREHHLKNKAMTEKPNTEASEKIKAKFAEIDERIELIEDKLSADKRRLEALEQRAEGNEHQMRILLRAQMAMLHHMIDGNNVSKLQLCYDEIETYLQNK